MADQSVPGYASVEARLNQLRPLLSDSAAFYAKAIGIVQGIVTDPDASDGVMVARVFNVVQAVELLHAVPVDPRDAKIARLEARIAEIEPHLPRASGAGPVDAIGRYPVRDTDALFADDEPKCGAYTPSGPCVLFPGHGVMCSPDPVLDQPVERPL